jgi:hypothetical protein
MMNSNFMKNILKAIQNVFNQKLNFVYMNVVKIIKIIIINVKKSNNIIYNF